MRGWFDISRFAEPWALWLLAAIPLMVGYYIWRSRQGDACVRLSTINGLRHSHRTLRYYLRHLPFVLRCCAVAMMAVALARPQSVESGSHSTTEGIDIILAIDVSGSMLARDFDPDRITAARETAAQFISDRRRDRIGIVVFAGESFTQSPLTTDQRTLQALITRVGPGMIQDGTAIGNGLATAINRLRESEAQSRVIILLTDGVNNAGEVSPVMAAEMAASFGIRVYTIGVGTHGTAPSPVVDAWGRLAFAPMKVEIDEGVLREIASMTGGEYFRATDNRSLMEVYRSIDALEKSRIESSDFTRYHEMFARWLLVALALLMLEFAVQRLVLRRIP